MARTATWIIVIVLCLAMAAGVFLGGPLPSPTGSGPGKAAESAVKPLASDAKARHAKMREVFANLLKKAGGDPVTLSTVEGKVAAVQTVLDAAEPSTRSTWELRCIAIVFADALVQGEKLEWLSVRDPEGQREAVAATGSDMLLFPRDIFVMQSKSPTPIKAQAIYDTIKSELAKPTK